MPDPFKPLSEALAAWQTRARRYRNWRAGARPGKASSTSAPPPAPGMLAWLPLLMAVLGGVVIAGHVLRLAPDGDTEAIDMGAGVYRDALPGAVIDVPRRTGAHVMAVQGGTVLALNGMQGYEPVHLNLCTQLRADGRLLLRLGAGAEETARRMPHVALLAGADVPAVRIESMAGGPLRLVWDQDAGAAWAGDGPAAGMLNRQGWLTWDGGALRFEQRALAACPRAGELLVQLYRPAPAPTGRCCKTIAFPAQGEAVAGMLATGRHTVPAAQARPPSLEDQALFADLQAHGLLRLDADGAIAVAPRDLPQWAQAAPGDRAAPLGQWEPAARDAAAMRVLKHLYRQADGDYVLRQVAIYNSERQLLAWRTPAASSDHWQLLAGEAPQPVADTMPAASARLFAQLPQGWNPWRRVAGWPAGAQSVVLQAAPAPGVMRLLVAGHTGAVQGARVRLRRDACTGKACQAAGDVTELWLEPDGAGPVRVTVQPLASVAAPGDARYRHIQLEQGRLTWQPLERGAAPAAGPDMRQVRQALQALRIADRHGAPLWRDGAVTAGARAAGLSAMLGVAPGHTSGIAGMLARAAAASDFAANAADAAHTAALTLDLPLQARAQAILDCVAMRRGRWDGAACSGGAIPAATPPERQAGIVLLDARSGDILAAAGAGNAPAAGASWAELRDFDRANPARSPLRLPALQHDGGAHRSPGSTFKIVSALGLELAARTDKQLDALLDGMAPADINRMAHARGYDFGTQAATYPVNGRVHITNYHEQSLERRVQDGRLGLRQALAYSQNTWFAWAAEWSDGSLLGRPEGGMPDVQALEPDALDRLRPIMAAAHRLGFGAPLQLDGGLLPADFRWSPYDALQATPARIDPVQSRHEIRQMAIGLRMQATPLHMAMAAGAIGEGATVTPRLLREWGGRHAQPADPRRLDVRLDRIRAGMKGVVDSGTAAGAFGAPALNGLRRGLYGKTGTAPTGEGGATVWFTGWLEPGMLPGQQNRLAFAVFVSHSEASGGEHAAPVVAALLADLAAGRAALNQEQKGK